MKVSSAVNLRSEKSSVEAVQSCVDAVLKAGFEYAVASGQLSAFENTLFVYMGLLKVILFPSNKTNTNLIYLGRFSERRQKVQTFLALEWILSHSGAHRSSILPVCQHFANVESLFLTVSLIFRNCLIGYFDVNLDVMQTLSFGISLYRSHPTFDLYKEETDRLKRVLATS